MRLSARDVQMILGPIADQVAGEIRAQLRAPRPAPAAAAGGARFSSTGAAVLAAGVASSLLSALGGAANVRELEPAAETRLRVTVVDGAAVDEAALRSLGLRGVARPAADRIHLVIGPGAEQTAAELRLLLKR
jgi:PTS system N-acetylglucosamine-specific IIC component